MFDIGWGELVVIGIVALIAIGPKELPGVLRSIGQWVGKLKGMASDFQGQFQEAMREAEVADLKKQFDEASQRGHEFHLGLRQSARERQEPDRKLVQGNAGAGARVRAECGTRDAGCSGRRFRRRRDIPAPEPPTPDQVGEVKRGDAA